MWLGISGLVTALVSVTCHTMSHCTHCPWGRAPLILTDLSSSKPSLILDFALCSAPLPVCSGLSVIKRSEDFLAKMFLQRKQAGSKSRGRFWKFNQIWPPPLSLLCGGHVSSPSPSLSCLGARAWSQPGLGGEWIETVRSFGGPMTLLQGREKIWTKLWQISLKYYYKILSVKYEQAFPVSIQE